MTYRITRLVVLAAIALAACKGNRKPPVHDPPAPPDATPEMQRQEDAGLAVRRGEEQATKRGCLSCHSIDGTSKVAPSFKGIWVRTVARETVFEDGRTLADLVGPGKQFPTAVDYLGAKFLTPRAIATIKDYPPSAPTYEGMFTDPEVSDVIAYLKTL